MSSSHPSRVLCGRVYPELAEGWAAGTGLGDVIPVTACGICHDLLSISWRCRRNLEIAAEE